MTSSAAACSQHICPLLKFSTCCSGSFPCRFAPLVWNQTSHLVHGICCSSVWRLFILIFILIDLQWEQPGDGSVSFPPACCSCSSNPIQATSDQPFHNSQFPINSWKVIVDDHYIPSLDSLFILGLSCYPNDFHEVKEDILFSIVSLLEMTQQSSALSFCHFSNQRCSISRVTVIIKVFRGYRSWSNEQIGNRTHAYY